MNKIIILILRRNPRALARGMNALLRFLLRREPRTLVRGAPLLSILIFSAYVFAFDNGDFQYWNSESIEWKVNKDWKVSLEEEFRFGDNAGDFYYQSSDLGATYSGLAKWFDLGINYKLIFEEKNDDWKYENRAHLNGTIKFDLYGLNFSDRNRIEYRNIEDKDDSWRYRNRFTINLPKFTKLEIQPYVADEIFYDFDEGELNRNRAYAGFSLKLLKNLKGEIFYLWQSGKTGNKWINYNIVGTKLKLSF